MQKYWTLLKLLGLGVALAGLVLVQRGPAYVSLHLIARADGELTAVEIDGDRISLNSPQSDLIEARFQSALVSRSSSGTPWIQIRVDDEILWADAKGGLMLAFSAEHEPKICVVTEFSESPLPGEQVVIHQPGLSTEDLSVTVTVRNDGPGTAGLYLNDSKFSPQNSLTVDQLNQAIRKLIGEPGSEKARRMRADIQIEKGVRFKDVREALDAVSGGRTVIIDKWVPYLQLFRIDGMEWSDSDRKFQHVRDALTQPAPFTTRGGVI